MKSLVLLTFLMGCSTTTITQLQPGGQPLKSCEVTLYADKADAEATGDIETVCIVSAVPGWGRTQHSIGNALNNAKKRVCSCGVDKAYIKDTHAPSFGSATAEIVGFRYKGQ